MPREATCDCGECPKCKKRIYMRKWYRTKSPEERRAIVEARDQTRVQRNDRERYERDKDKRLAAQAAYRQTEQGRERNREGGRAWAKRHPEKAKAKQAVNNAIRDGRLQRGSRCEQADDTCAGRLQAHHDDYAKPLEVRWLCESHHKRHHKTVREGMRVRK